MPISDKDKGLERLQKEELKQQVKTAKADVKDYSRDKAITSEASRYGVDFNKPLDVGVLTKERKDAIDKRTTALADQSEIDRLRNFQEATKAPSIQTDKMPDKEYLKENYRKQRNARWWDALYALGEGLQGRTADPRNMRSKQLEAERKGMYDQYKSSFEQGKKTLSDWEENYAKQQIDYLKELRDKETNSMKRKQFDNELKIQEAKLANYKPQTEANVEKTYPNEYKTDDGQRIKMNLSPEDQVLFNQNILEVSNLKAERDQLQAKMDEEYSRAESRGLFGLSESKEEAQDKVKNRYNPKIEEINAKIKEAETGIISLSNGNPTPKQSDTEGIDPWDL